MSATSAGQDTHDSPAEQLFSVATYSDDDGRVLGEIIDWGKTDTDDGTPDVYVEVLLPNGETFQQTFNWPAKDSTEHEFVQLVEQAGWSLASVDHLEGSKVKCEQEWDDGWQVHLEPQSTGVLRGLLLAGVICLGSAVGAVIGLHVDLGVSLADAVIMVGYQVAYVIGGGGIAGLLANWAFDLFAGRDN